MRGLGEQDLPRFRWIFLQQPCDGEIVRELGLYSGDEALYNPCLAQEVLDQPSYEGEMDSRSVKSKARPLYNCN